MQAILAEIETIVVGYPVSGWFKFFSADAGRPAVRETVVIRIADRDGNVGWGQSVPSPTWSYETIETVRTTIERHLAPALLGRDAFEARAIQSILDRTIAGSFSTGQPICKAGLDLALFDLIGRICKQSAADRWQRSIQSEIVLSWTINPRALGDVAEDVERAQARGFRHFNVKVGADAGFDCDVCRELRRLAPDAFIWVDANGGYDLDSALVVAPRFADLGLAAFEQPVPANRLLWFRQVKKQAALPILMDEPIVSRVDLQTFHQLGLLDGIAMKVSRSGGLTESRHILDYVENNGLLFFASGLTDPDLSLAASLLLFAAHGLERPAALNATQYLHGSILSSPIEICEDRAVVPIGPGLGADVDEAAVRRAATLQEIERRF